MLDGRVGIGLVPLLARGPIPLDDVLVVLEACLFPGACGVGAPAAVPTTLMPSAGVVVLLALPPLPPRPCCQRCSRGRNSIALL